MKSFKDTEGREWVVRISVGTILSVRKLVNIDLLEAVGGDVLQRIASDPVLLVNVLYCVCKAQADERNLSDEQFAYGLGGDALDQAAEALLQGIVDFFQPSKRPQLQKALQKFRALEQRQTEYITSVMDGNKLDLIMEREIQKADLELEKLISGDLSTNSPDSSA